MLEQVRQSMSRGLPSRTIPVDERGQDPEVAKRALNMQDPLIDLRQDDGEGLSVAS
jgi:hypothetical protein